MDSINRNQSEENRADLISSDAIEKIKELVGKSGNCFFCTSPNSGNKMATRPMSVREVDDAGSIWFLSAADSHKNEDVALDPNVRLYFQGSTHSDFLALSGTATITTDKAVIKRLWEPLLKTWFTEGEDDPRITALKIDPTEGYYWDTKHGNAVAGMKMMIGAVLGKTLDDSIEGNIRLR